MATRSDLLTWGGAALLAFGGLLWFDQKKPASTATTPPAGTAPPASGACSKPGRGSIVVPSRFYNWSDLSVLPINPSNPHNWSTGGTTSELGWPLGTSVFWSEAKQGIANDGRSGWFVRVSGAYPGMQPGDWALPAADLAVANPCA